MKCERIFYQMFPLTPKFPTSTPSLSCNFSIPPPYANACTCIFLLGIWTPKKTLCLPSHSHVSSVNVTFLALINTSKKVSRCRWNLPILFSTHVLVCSMPKQKKHFKPQFFVLCPPPRQAHFGFKSISLGHGKVVCSSDTHN